MKCLLAVIRKEFRHVLRDPYLLGGVLLGTVLLLVLISYAVSADINGIPIAIYDGDRTPQSQDYLRRFSGEEFFEVRHFTPTAGQARELLRANRVRGVIIVPRGFALALLQGKPAPVQIIADGTEPSIAMQIAGYAEALSTAHSVDLLTQRIERTALADDEIASPLEFRVRTLYNPKERELNAFLPGMIGFVMTLPAMYAGLSLVREREQGSLESLLSTPIRRHQLIIGKATPYLVIGLLDTLILTAVAVLVFDVPFRGRLTHLVLLSALFLLSNIGLSLVVSSMLRTQMAALIVNGLVMMVPLTQSGLVTPIYTMTPGGQIQALMWPVTHYVVITRGLFLKGIGPEILMDHALYLLASGVVLSGLAVWQFKKKLDRQPWTSGLLRRIRRNTVQAGYWLRHRVEPA
jgi:ABC-2 type transport system permease protein